MESMHMIHCIPWEEGGGNSVHFWVVLCRLEIYCDLYPYLYQTIFSSILPPTLDWAQKNPYPNPD